MKKKKKTSRIKKSEISVGGKKGFFSFELGFSIEGEGKKKRKKERKKKQFRSI